MSGDYKDRRLTMEELIALGMNPYEAEVLTTDMLKLTPQQRVEVLGAYDRMYDITRERA